MINLNLKNLLLQKGLKPSIYALERMGIGRNSANNMLKNTAKSISFTHLEILCRHLNCTPRELLYYSFAPCDLPPRHPLWDWNELSTPQPLQALSPDQINELNEYVKAFMQKSVESNKSTVPDASLQK